MLNDFKNIIKDITPIVMSLSVFMILRGGLGMAANEEISSKEMFYIGFILLCICLIITCLYLFLFK